MTLTEGQKRAIEKLDKEMEAAKDPCSKYIAEQLLQLATSCPKVAEKILEEKKTLAGALDAIKAEAKKHAVGGCGCVDEAQAVDTAAAAAQRRVDGDLRLVRIHAVEIQLHHAAHHIEHLRTFVAFMIPQKR